MSSILPRGEEAKTAAAGLLELQQSATEERGGVAAGSVSSGSGSNNSDKDVYFWQRSLEALAQKVIVGDTAVALKASAREQADREAMHELPESDQQQDVGVNSGPTTTPPEDGAGSSSVGDQEDVALEQGQQQQQQQQQHDSNLFRLSCCCQACLGYRETIIQLFVEDFEYNTLWERLQLLIKKFYDFIPEQDDSVLYRRYMKLMEKSSLKWLTDGRINTKKNIQISLGSNLPLSNEMTFILVFSMLYTRDPHQLFELLCLQLRSIVKAYSQGLDDLIQETSDGELQYNPTDLLNYILDGYDKLCNSAKALSPLLFELQRGHLQQFSLTWCLINKRMFQRYVYFEVQKVIPECILKLKELLFDEEYKSMVFRFIQFDDDMNSTSQIWRDVWSLLHDYHKARDDSARRKRISSAHSLMVAVKESEFNFVTDVQRQRDRPIVEWLALENRYLVWEFVVHSLKSRWIACVNPRLTASIENVQCRKCNFALATHYIGCDCRTCLIAGGTCLGILKEQLYCAKCSFFKKLDRDYLDYIGEFFNKPLNERLEKKLNGMTTPSISGSSSSSTTDIAVPSEASESESQGDRPASAPGATANNNSDGSSSKDAAVASSSEPTQNTALTDKSGIYHISWAIFKHLPDRCCYTWTTLEPKRFCIFQGEPCRINACRVAINIIAMLYPLNLSKFLIKSYHPLKEEERRKMAENWNIDVKNFMQRFCDDINKRWRTEMSDRIHPLHFLDLLWESDDSESSLLSDMASAFAEWFLIDFQFPQRNVIYQYFTKFFLVKGTDIEFDMKCFETVSGSRLFNWSTPTSPLRQMIEDDMQSKLLGVNWSSIIPEEALAAINGEDFASGQSDCSSLVVATASGSNSSIGSGSATMAAAVIEPLVKFCSEDGTICNDCKDCFADSVTKSEIFEKEIKKPLVEALKLAASNKILETELKSLQKEHSMLKDMVRDLEQIHEQKHSIAQQCVGINSAANILCNSNASSIGNKLVAAITNSKSIEISLSKSVSTNNTKPTTPASILPAAAAMLKPSNSSNAPIVVTKSSAISPAKALLNQATNALPKNGPIGQQPQPTASKINPAAAAVLSQQQHPSPNGSKLLATKAPGSNGATLSKAMQNSSVAMTPGTATQSVTGKVSSKGTSTHPASANNGAAPIASPSTSSNGVAAAAAAAVSSCNPHQPHHPIQSKEEHKRTCHRGGGGGAAAAAGMIGAGEKSGDGSCVCYYCTLFGQSVCLECNHNQRTNETRDRLRKKIKQLQSNKDNQQLKSLNLKNIKIPPGGLLKKINTNKSNSTNVVTGATVPTSLTTSAGPIPPSSVAASITKESITSKVEAMKNSNFKPSTAGANLAAAVSAAAKIPMVQNPSLVAAAKAAKLSESSIMKPREGHLIPRAAETVNAGPVPLVKKLIPAPPPPPTMAEQSLDDIVRYIEGDDGDDKQSGGGKKTGKKTKQKHKKQELKKIFELGKLSGQFWDLEEQRAQKRMQFQQNLKKKDKKQLLEDIKAFEIKKLQLQTDINSLVSSIRNINPEFHFNVDGMNDPTKENKDTGASKAAPRKPEATKEPPVPQKVPNKLQQNINLIQQQQQKERQPNSQQQQPPKASSLSPQDNVNVDPARRMVTIKRTFLSQSEPQVTVTAKGASPEQDQLLYTFVNGQLISPASETSPVSSRQQQKAQQQQQQGTPRQSAQQQQQMQQQLKMKMALNDARQLSEMFSKNQIVTGDTDIWITEKLLKLSLKEQSQQQQAQSMREIDELMQKIQAQSIGGIGASNSKDRKKKEDVVSLINKLTDKLTHIRNKAKNSMSEAQAKAAAQMLNKIVNKLELEMDDPEEETAGSKQKKTKKKKKEKRNEEIDEIDEIVARLDGLDVGSGSKKSERNIGKNLNRKLSKDSVSSTGSSQKVKDVKEQKSKEKGKPEPVKEKKSEVKEVVETKKKVIRKKNDGFIDPEFDNNAFKLLNLDDSGSEEEIEVEDVVGGDKETEDVAVVDRLTRRTPSPEPVPVVETPRPMTPPEPVSVPTVPSKKPNKKKPEKIKEITPPPVKETELQKNKENASPTPVSVTQKKIKNIQNTSNNSQSSNKKTPSPSIVQPTEKPTIDDANLSKRQKKLLKQQQEQTKNVLQSSLKKQQQYSNTQQSQPTNPSNRQIDKAVKTAKSSSSNNSDRQPRSRATTSADTTLELINESKQTKNTSTFGTPSKIPNTFPPGDTSFGASIMDQLSRGIRVEGLQLPPGITLTRVDPAQAEVIKAKRESIKKICEPMKTVQPEQPKMPPHTMMMSGGGPSVGAPPGMFMMNPMMGGPPQMMGAAPGAQDAVIMVDTNKLQGSNEGDKKSGKKKNRKNKSKNKSDSSNKDGAGIPNHHQKSGERNVKNQKSNGNKIVTLRNPMFQGAPSSRVPSNDPSNSGNSGPNNGFDPQQATIFKNDNGMYTIRNPALHQALSGAAPASNSGFRPFNTNYLLENGLLPPGGTATVTAVNYLQQQQQAKEYNALLNDGPSSINSKPFSATVEPPRKCNSAIGSEMKKQKQQSHHNPWHQMNGGGTSGNGTSHAGNDPFNSLGSSQRSYSPFESLQYGLSGNQEYIGDQGSPAGYFPINSPSTVSAIGSERSHARAQAAAALSVGSDANCRSRLFGTNGPSSLGGSSSGGHCCDDSPTSSYFDSLHGTGSNHKYDDMSFLQNLQPGQRLNSEVTIHNINESKFLRQQGQSLPNDIEITRIPGPGSSATGYNSHSAPGPQTPVSSQQHRLLMSPVSSSPLGGMLGNEHLASLAVGLPSTGGGNVGAVDPKMYTQNYQSQQMHLQQQLTQQMQQLQLQAIGRPQQQQLIGEFGENNIFAPNQMVNLNELESEERDIEAFKRFNYYFDPPKDKTKINLNVKELVGNSKKTSSTIGSGSPISHQGSQVPTEGGSIKSNNDSSNSSVCNDLNLGGVSITEDIQPIRPQAPIGTPSQKVHHQHHHPQQQMTPPATSTTTTVVGSGISGVLYPANSDSPASSASLFDGISSSMSSHAHSCDDLYNDLLSSGTAGGAVGGNLGLNLNLNFTHLQQSNSDPIAYDSVGSTNFGIIGTSGNAASLGSVIVAGSSSNNAPVTNPSASEMPQSLISN
ncbi:uncharacterized protein LOC129740536 [Uranotaenia lowii]|uniref:uncharacterized protein LOC129740536 n=1 Tax=Uranotaenia lowii TaxID=190385 RepID=UPI0024788A89|nr:uncharacterized protein LOC129740536 [Uranotaenia lowii]